MPSFSFVYCIYKCIHRPFANHLTCCCCPPPGYCGLLVEGPVTFSVEATANLQHQVNLIRWPRMFLLPQSQLRVYKNAPTLQVRDKLTLSLVSCIWVAKTCCVMWDVVGFTTFVGRRPKKNYLNLVHLTCSFVVSCPKNSAVPQHITLISPNLVSAK